MALNSQITIQQRTSATDALGQPVETWSDLITLWGDVRRLSGLQQIKNEAEVSTVRISIKTYLRSDINPAMRVIHGASTYDIKAVLPDDQGRVFMFLACEQTA